MMQRLFKPAIQANSMLEIIDIHTGFYDSFTALKSELDTFIAYEENQNKDRKNNINTICTFLFILTTTLGTLLALLSKFIGHDTSMMESRDCRQVQIRQHSMWWNAFSSSNYQEVCTTSIIETTLPNTVDIPLAVVITIVVVSGLILLKTAPRTPNANINTVTHKLNLVTN